MSYSIRIGNAVVEEHAKDIKDYDGEYVAEYVVKDVQCEDAPYYHGDEMSNKVNGRHPGYLQFETFVNEAHIWSLFFDERYGLMRKHPGIFALNISHLQIIQMARKEWEKDHLGTEPGWGIGKDGIERDGVLARLIWFEWWMKWALENCQYPAIFNR